MSTENEDLPEEEPDQTEDVLYTYEDAAIERFKRDTAFLNRLVKSGVPWRGIIERLRNYLPDVMSDRISVAHNLVPKALTAVFGKKRYWMDYRETSG